MDEQEFKTRADEAMQALYRKLSAASDRYDFEPDFQAGALSVEFEEPRAKFVVSPNTPVRQVWVSANSKSFKLDWDAGRSAFVLPESQETLDEVMESAISRLTGEEVTL